jgi:hypothetical protein
MSSMLRLQFLSLPQVALMAIVPYCWIEHNPEGPEKRKTKRRELRKDMRRQLAGRLSRRVRRPIGQLRT